MPRPVWVIAGLAFCLIGCDGGGGQINTPSPFDRFSTTQNPLIESRAFDSKSDVLTSTTVEVKFKRCRKVRDTCVVDGDTIWISSEKIRLADIDTPEVSRPSCANEKILGERATDRLIALLNEGPFEIAQAGNRDEDRYGRKLRILLRNGQSLGDQLVSEGLARNWTGAREPWC
jgi:micrococcal nuclease